MTSLHQKEAADHWPPPCEDSICLFSARLKHFITKETVAIGLHGQ